jgi:hypothetical protein
MPWYFGGGATRYYTGKGASWRLSASGPFESVVPYCGGGYWWIS